MSWQLAVSLALPPALFLLLCGVPPLALAAAAVALVIGCVLYWRSPDGSEQGRRGYAIVAAVFVLLAIALSIVMARGPGGAWPHGWPTWLGWSGGASHGGGGP